MKTGSRDPIWRLCTRLCNSCRRAEYVCHIMKGYYLFDIILNVELSVIRVLLWRILMVI